MECDAASREVRTNLSIELVPVDNLRSSSSSAGHGHDLAVAGCGIDSAALLYSQLMDVCQGVDLAEVVGARWTRCHTWMCACAIPLEVSLLITGVLVSKYAHLTGILGPLGLGVYLVASPFGAPSEAPTVLVQYLIRIVLVAASLIFAYLAHIYRNCSQHNLADEAWVAAQGGLMQASHFAHETAAWTQRSFTSFNFMNLVVTFGAGLSVFSHRQSKTIAFDMRLALCNWLYAALASLHFLIIRACGFFSKALKEELSASHFMMERVVVTLLCMSITRRVKLFEGLLKQPLCAGYSCIVLDALTVALLFVSWPFDWPSSSSWTASMVKIGITCVRLLGVVVSAALACLVCFAYRRVQQISVNEAACLDAGSNKTWASSRLQKSLEENMRVSVICLLFMSWRFLSRVVKDLFWMAHVGEATDDMSFHIVCFFLAVSQEIFIGGTQLCLLRMVRGFA